MAVIIKPNFALFFFTRTSISRSRWGIISCFCSFNSPLSKIHAVCITIIYTFSPFVVRTIIQFIFLWSPKCAIYVKVSDLLLQLLETSAHFCGPRLCVRPYFHVPTLKRKWCHHEGKSHNALQLSGHAQCLLAIWACSLYS